MKLLFIGAGNLAESLISGFIRFGNICNKNIYIKEIVPEREKYILKKYRVNKTAGLADAAGKVNIIVLCVKPKDIESVLLNINKFVNSRQLIISVAAGITTGYIESYLKKTPVIRIMTNIAVSVQQGMSVICKGKYATGYHLKQTEKLFNAVGKASVFPEKLFNSVTAVSGSGPAYIFYISELMVKAANRLGIPSQPAEMLVNQVIAGAAKMLIESPDSAEILRRKVTSPGGTTEQAILNFNKNKLIQIHYAGVSKAQKRAKELTK